MRGVRVGLHCPFHFSRFTHQSVSSVAPSSASRPTARTQSRCSAYQPTVRRRPSSKETWELHPSSPYSASKAGADHLARAWHRTYGLPVLITNCSNNYGPYQHPEKLIPVVILNALDGEPLPVYGTGENVRDWLYVKDHVRALLRVLHGGRVGETYNVGGDCEKQNIAVVRQICDILDKKCPDALSGTHRDLITFVEDRPGHDWRYAIDASKIETDLGWAPEVSFEEGLRRTVDWYVEHRDWVRAVGRDADEGTAEETD